jgi:tetratricopeptide (TPR) repeat protein
LSIIATSPYSGATCLITRDGRQLLRKTLNLGPENATTVTLPEAAQSPVEVTITNGKQQVLASFVTPLPIPKTPEPKPSDLMRKPDEQLTLQEKYLKGRKFDLATNRRRAREYYEKALAEDEQFSPALRSLAVLDIEAGLYEKAAGRLREAVKRDDNDGLSWYFLGVSNLRLGDYDEALRCAYKAIRCLSTDSLGCDLAGRAFMRQGENSKAVEIFRRAVRLNPDDYKAKDHLILALYAAGRKKQAFKQAEALTAKNPTALVPRMVLALRNKDQMNRFVRDARAFVGEDEFEILEAGLVFAEVAMANEAEELLRAACIEAVPEEQRSPMPLYYLAYFASLQKDEAGAKAYLEQAARLNRDFVFPSRPEEVAVFEYAVENNPGDAHAHLYLGNLYSHLDRQDDAVRQWSKAVELDSSLSVAFRNLGLYAWSAEEDLSKAEGFYRKAIAARPEDQTLYRDLADILLAAKKRPDAIKVLESMPFENIRRADIIIMLAQMYLDEQQYTDTIDLLESTPYFVNWEGQTITWDIFHKAHLERGRQRFEKEDFTGALHDFEASLTYPKNIGVGRSNRPQEASAQYWRGKALQALGRLDEARLAWKEGAAGREGSNEQNEHIELCKKALSM